MLGLDIHSTMALTSKMLSSLPVEPNMFSSTKKQQPEHPMRWRAWGHLFPCKPFVQHISSVIQPLPGKLASKTLPKSICFLCSRNLNLSMR